jgi:predicted secreted hydrolase
MVHGKVCNPVSFHGGAVNLAAGLAWKEHSHGKATESNYHTGFDYFHLAVQPGAAILDFRRQRITVSGRAALDDVGDKDFLAVQPDSSQ